MWRNEYVKFTIAFFLGVLVFAGTISGCKTKKKVLGFRALPLENVETSSYSFIRQFRDTSKIKKRYLKNECRVINHFFYDEEHPYLHEKKRIRVNFHFVNSKDSLNNFNPDKGYKYAKGVVYHANIKLKGNEAMKLPEGNTTPVHPVPFRYVLTPDGNVPGDNGVYYHYVDDPFFVNHGKNSNNYDRSLIDKLKVNQDSVLNIFYMVHHPDSVKSKTYRPKPAGIALGHSVKLGVNGSKEVEQWTHSSLLNHEIGHVLSLSHSWIKNDGCEDTPPNPNCWNTGPSPCDGLISNNVMDYNSTQMSYSPCQIARTYRTLMNEKSSKRNMVLKDWCNYNPKKTISIRDTQVWNRTVDVYGDLVIEEGGLLISNCSINMPEKSSIVVKGGGEFLMNNTLIKNDCDRAWKGLFIDDSNGEKAKISYVDTFYIENIEILTIPIN